MKIDDYEVLQTKSAIKIIKDNKVVYMRPKRKEYTDKELKQELRRYKEIILL